MDESPNPSDPQGELAELRRRAYGRDADIQNDPVALARLWELEGAHLARASNAAESDFDARSVRSSAPAEKVATADRDAEDAARVADAEAELADVEDSPGLPGRRLTTTRAGRITVLAGALAAALVLGYTAVWALSPHPNATLRPTPDAANGPALDMIDFLGGSADEATILGYERYRGITPWFFVDGEQGLHCFMLVTRGPGVDGANCVPPGVDLFADITPWPQFVDENSHTVPEGSVIRFRYLKDRVDVYVYPAAHPD